MVLEGGEKSGTLKIGFAECFFSMGRGMRGYLNFNKNGVIYVKLKVVIPAGSIINVNGKLYLGEDFESNANRLVSCETEICFGYVLRAQF